MILYKKHFTSVHQVANAYIKIFNICINDTMGKLDLILCCILNVAESDQISNTGHFKAQFSTKTNHSFSEKCLLPKSRAKCIIHTYIHTYNESG